MYLRIGHGYDVHKLVKNRLLVLGGVIIDHEYGLIGHSDADVLVHAIIDSFLGATTMGSIGDYFPDSDKKYKDARSIDLLAKIVKNAKAKIINIDTTVIVQEPKLQKYSVNMRKNISCACSIKFDDINIKFKTEEGLGFTGRKEGISSHSVCLIKK
ncbi:MAG: 2-C-methyl-D-erythritol 2,4-cyclodiphosphate synthase [Firmicutes bacterium]|nr:2-C-methyl-D-erythritol 2,4-cyclodiphosphate synthase [Bacillota bacterium]